MTRDLFRSDDTTKSLKGDAHIGGSVSSRLIHYIFFDSLKNLFSNARVQNAIVVNSKNYLVFSLKLLVDV